MTQQRPAASTTSRPPVTASITVRIRVAGEAHQTTRRVCRMDWDGSVHDDGQLLREALARGVRDLYGPRALWWRDHGTSSGLEVRPGEIHEYGNVVLDRTPRERQQGVANVLANTVYAEVWLT